MIEAGLLSGLSDEERRCKQEIIRNNHDAEYFELHRLLMEQRCVVHPARAHDFPVSCARGISMQKVCG